MVELIRCYLEKFVRDGIFRFYINIYMDVWWFMKIIVGIYWD